MPARTNRREARERIFKVMTEALDRMIPPDESTPLRGSTFADWEEQAAVVRQAVIPAAGISSNAKQLARFYQMLVRGGELDGVRVMQSVTIMEARRLSSDGVIDAFIKRPVRWAQGFQLGGPSKDPRDMARVMGMTSSPDSFGHAGNASCLTWADPTRHLVLVYLSNIQPRIDQGIQHLSMISDEVLATFG